MRGRGGCRRHQRSTVILATLILAFSCYVDKVLSSYSPDSIGYADQYSLLNEPNLWPVFKRNLGSLAREGYIKGRNVPASYKRSIATLAKNGQLPTFQSPEETTEQDTNEEKRNIASIAKMRSFDALKRNIESLARNGFRSGKRMQIYNYDEKRNIGALARNGYLRTDPEKKGGNSLEDEYYFPFYQHPLPPLSEVENPWTAYNDYVDSQNPSNMYPNSISSLPQSYGKRNAAALLRQDSYMQRNSGRLRPTPDTYNEQNEQDNKRSSIGLPNHGLYRNNVKRSIPDQQFDDERAKRSMNTVPDNYYNGILSEDYDVDHFENEDKRSLASPDGFYEPNTFDKRHIGSLARLGWLPSFRYSGSRYSRSGRARLFYPSNRELNRQYSIDSDFRIRQHVPDNTEDIAEANADIGLQRAAVPYYDSHSLPALRGATLSLPPHQIEHPAPEISRPPVFRHNPYDLKPSAYFNTVTKTTWDEAPAYVNLRQTDRNYSTLRSLAYPSTSTSYKRYLLLPAVDKILLRKTYPNNTLPSRRKNL